MHYHIILTEKCNLQCKYCYEKSIKEFDNGLEKKFKYDFSVPIESKVKTKDLKKFLDSKDTLIFYGGEPLTKIPKIIEIMDNVNCKFCIQTNALLLNKLPKKYLLKLNKILVSIDGTKKRTNQNRGEKTYEKIIKNLFEIRKKGYCGEIVARMTISNPDIFFQVKYLIKLIDKKIFDSIHWQIDAGFYKEDFNKEKFSKFVKEYNKQINRLVKFWILRIRKGHVYKLYPFLGIFNTLYTGKKSLLPCGAGYSNYTINTLGKLSACPIMGNIKNFYCGDIFSKNKIKKIKISEDDCIRCNYFYVCGGRCLYWKKAKLWPKQGDKLICKTIINLINQIEKNFPEIKQLINEKKVSKKDFEFEKYFGPEIIP